MQKHLSVLAVIVIAMSLHSISYAQIEKGTKLIGGSVNFINNKLSNNPDTSQSRQNSDNFSFSTRTDIGYFIKDNVALGVTGGYFKGYGKNENSIGDYRNISDVKNDGANVGVFIKYYIPTVSKLYITLTGALAYEFAKSNSSSETIENGHSNRTHSIAKNNAVGLGITPGLAYFITRRFALETTISGISASHSFTEEIWTEGGKNTSRNRSSTSIRLNPFDFRLGDLYIGGKFYF